MTGNRYNPNPNKRPVGGLALLTDSELPVDRCHRCRNSFDEPSLARLVERDSRDGSEEWQCTNCFQRWWRYPNGEIRRPNPPHVKGERLIVCQRCTIAKPEREFNKTLSSYVGKTPPICLACQHPRGCKGRATD
jgi:hypothetical protein